MGVHQARGFFSILVVVAHIVFVFYCAFFLKDRITKFETYLSTLACFLPVFGVYVSIVVKNIDLKPVERSQPVSTLFLILAGVLFVAYVVANVAVVYAYGIQFIRTEDLLPAAFATVEAAFGGFFTTLFLTLFGVSSLNSPTQAVSPRDRRTRA
jgi:hypothetical protein